VAGWTLRNTLSSLVRHRWRGPSHGQNDSKTLSEHTTLIKVSLTNLMITLTHGQAAADLAV
jgi:hypothetical protein